MVNIYLVSAISSALVAFILHALFKIRRDRKVRYSRCHGLVTGDSQIQTHRLTNNMQANDAIAESHGCLPAPRLQNHRPLGLDRLEQIFRADNESRLMELFQFHFRQTGSTLEQVFLGTSAFGTIEPANLEALLSTNFKGLFSSYLTVI